ncbi:MAG: hypothetical protein Q8L98_02250 [Chlamydiales bacterium]|nr:hypothetical protein [Chlamydiales bacterium]
MTSPVHPSEKSTSEYKIIQETTLEFTPTSYEDSNGNTIKGSVEITCADKITEQAIDPEIFDNLKKPSQVALHFLIANKEECMGLLEIFVKSDLYYNDLPLEVQQFVIEARANGEIE